MNDFAAYAAVGVPLIAPVEASKETPGGSCDASGTTSCSTLPIAPVSDGATDSDSPTSTDTLAGVEDQASFRTSIPKLKLLARPLRSVPVTV